MKKFSQKDKQERGVDGEQKITSSLRSLKLWQYKFINAGFGTVFDKLVIPPGGGYALEIKVRQEPRIAHNIRSITQNERKGLTKFMEQVGKDNAYIIGIWQTEEFSRAFLIPWHAVQEQVCSGVRGSINMLDFKELPKRGSMWDLSCFKR